MKQQKKKVYKDVRVYFNPSDAVHMETFKALKELSKAIGVSMSTAAGMAIRRGAPLVKESWDELQKQ